MLRIFNTLNLNCHFQNAIYQQGTYNQVQRLIVEHNVNILPSINALIVNCLSAMYILFSSLQLNGWVESKQEQNERLSSRYILLMPYQLTQLCFLILVLITNKN